MKRITWAFGLYLSATFFSLPVVSWSQQKVPTATVRTADVSSIPSLVKYSGTLTDGNGKPLTDVVGVTFYLYREEQGGSPLWLETQNVRPDKFGRYTVQLGSASAQGLPMDLFASGDARWLGVQTSGQQEQPRVMLLAVPYALKAGDAATVGGLPASAFMLAAQTSSSGGNTASASEPSSKAAAPPAGTVTGSGTLNFVPLWTSTSSIGNSVLFQSGAGSSAKVGINTTAPGSTFDVKGTTKLEGLLTLPSQGIATASGGKASQAQDFAASTFNSSNSSAVNQTFQLKAEPAGNNTATPSGTLNLLFASGTSTPTETGLRLSSKGLFTFAAGQTFPGSGTITGVTTGSGSGLTGGGTQGSLSLTLLKTCTKNQTLQWNDTAWVCATPSGSGTITGVTAGTDLTGGGASGNVTLNLDTTKVPQLNTTNIFNGTQTVNGSLTVAGGSAFQSFLEQTSSTFGTWLALSNTSAGGHTWNIISAGGANSEGSGNLGITDLTGKSTIWLEGNVNTGNIVADDSGLNAGSLTPGVQFGGSSSGESIASDRISGPNQFGLDFFTNFTRRVSILNNGQVGIGTNNATGQLEVDAASNGYSAIVVRGGPTQSGSGQSGGTGLQAQGSAGDLTFPLSFGGSGISATGGLGSLEGGNGGTFTGGPSATSDPVGAGDGLDAYPGAEATGNFAPYAGFFHGNLATTGAVNGSIALMSMDHPLDPANKYLVHAAVESPDMMNVYCGNAVTDANGYAVVEMPEWFEAINRDFRYQLTVVGQFAQAIIASKISGNKFSIRTDKPNVEVSWQVTGIRQDVWSNSHRLSVEVEKSGIERGHYLHPELYGASEEQGIARARHPETMQRMKKLRQNNQADGIKAQAVSPAK